MVLFKKTKNTYKIIFEKETKVDLSKVYNSLFFSVFPLIGLRVFKSTSQETLDNNGTQQEVVNSLGNNPDENEILQQKVIDIFGKEQVPNSYSELPLSNENVQEVEEEETQPQQDDSIYDSISTYLTKYLPNSVSKDKNESENNMKITIPFGEEYVVNLEEKINNSNNDELFSFSNVSNIGYSELEQMVADFYIQIKYLMDMGFIYETISLSSIFYVQKRYVIFDESIVIMDKEREVQEKKMNRVFLDLVAKILNLSLEENSELTPQLKKIQHTKIYYFLKRIEREGIMEWV